jgi:uracil-DNA glycosylase family 4
MDAKAGLRALLEQRLEAGEVEIVFDRLTAAQAIAALKALDRPNVGGRGGRGDWREALRAAGVDAAVRERGTSPARATEEPPQTPAWVPPRKSDVAAPPPLPVRAGLVVGAGDSELFGGAFAELSTLGAVAAAVAGCTRCALYQTAKNPVPGSGSENAELVCVGEAPGEKEDESGEPFVGQAGQLLTKILAAIKLSRQDVFICNVLKHRPPGNRNPFPHEVQACSPYLLRQLELIRPKAILAFGTFAAQTLLQSNQKISHLRGYVHRYYGIPLVATYHPAALLRNQAWKRDTWEDVKLVRRILDSSAPFAGP